MAKEHRLDDIEWCMMDRAKLICYTGLSSALGRTILYPLVVVKVRLQVQKQKDVYSGSLDAFKKILRTEGVRYGLFKGFWTNVPGQALSGMTYIVAYEKTRDLITKYTNISDSKAKAFLAGGISSAISQAVITPFDVISQHIMMASNTGRQSKKSPVAKLRSTYFKPLSLNQDEIKRFGLILTVIRQLHREGGSPRSFYRGFFASLICMVPSGAFWWTLYQYCNEFLYSLSATSNEHRLFLNCISGAFTGAAVSITTNPLDLLRANIQVHRPSSYRSAVKYLWKEDRWRIFNKGLSARVTQSCISSVLIVIGYEMMKKYSVNEEYRNRVR